MLCCFALFVCLTLLASFFLPSHLSLKTCTCTVYVHVQCMYMYIVYIYSTLYTCTVHSIHVLVQVPGVYDSAAGERVSQYSTVTHLGDSQNSSEEGRGTMCMYCTCTSRVPPEVTHFS